MASTYKFSALPNINIPRTAMNVEAVHPTSFQHGKIIPLFCIPVGPAENYKLYLNSLIRMSNPIFPFYGDNKVFIHTFHVPMRLVWEHTAEFFGENVLSKGPQPIEYRIPYALYGSTVPTYADGCKVASGEGGESVVDPTAVTVSSGLYAPTIGSVSHYLGKPLPTRTDYATATGDDAAAGDCSPKLSILKERAFWLIYNEYYRPQQLIDPINVVTDDSGTIGYDPNRMVDSSHATRITFATQVPTCAKMYDYFRSATVAPIYSGTEITIPVGATAPIITADIDTVDVSALTPQNPLYWAYRSNDTNFVNINDGELVTMNSRAGATARMNYSGTIPSNSASVVPANLAVDLSRTTAETSVDYLRKLFAQYNFLYRDNFGTRYPEIIQTHFNLKPSIAILNRPEIIHEGSFNINVSQVLSTAGATDDGQSKLGQPGANSVTANRQLVCNKSFEEWGFLFVCLETKHKRIYAGGVDAYDLRANKFDFYFPEFAMIGNKKIQVSELSVDIGPYNGIKADSGFGYQEAYAEERYFRNHVSGLLDPRATVNLDYMSLAEDLDPSIQIMSKEFVLEDRDAIANVLVTGSNGPDYTGDFALTGVMAKPMPLYSEPGLIDHIGAW